MNAVLVPLDTTTFSGHPTILNAASPTVPSFEEVEDASDLVQMFRDFVTSYHKFARLSQRAVPEYEKMKTRKTLLRVCGFCSLLDENVAFFHATFRDEAFTMKMLELIATMKIQRGLLQRGAFLYTLKEAQEKYHLIDAALTAFFKATRMYRNEITESVAKYGPVVRYNAGIYPSGLECVGWENNVNA